MASLDQLGRALGGALASNALIPAALNQPARSTSSNKRRSRTCQFWKVKAGLQTVCCQVLTTMAAVLQIIHQTCSLANGPFIPDG